jgi:hypothetical protein
MAVSLEKEAIDMVRGNEGMDWQEPRNYKKCSVFIKLNSNK